MLTKQFITLSEKAILPDAVIRAGIRSLCRSRLRDLRAGSLTDECQSYENHVRMLVQSQIAVQTQAANAQHYEVPPKFFEYALGPNLKYSSCFFPVPSSSLEEAELEALRQTMERAELQDGQEILELGCGWGSLTLAMAKRFPNAKITAISNSAPQRLFIENKAHVLGLTNITVMTYNLANAESLELKQFDRIVSVEMMEHLRNYERFFAKVSSWLKPTGAMFVHIFTHREASYLFETEGEDNWMGRHFFTGGQMPAHTLFSRFQNHLKLKQTWMWSGEHYSLTSEHWLKNLDNNRSAVLQLFRESMAQTEAEILVQRWRMFFMACAELFGYADGKEWGVSHYLFENRRKGS